MSERVNMFDLPPKERKEAERQNAAEVMAEYRDRVFYTRTDYGRGETDYVRIYVADRDRIHDLTYYVARALDLPIKDRGIPHGGGGYNKGLDAAMSAFHAAGGGFGEFDQANWQELR